MASLAREMDRAVEIASRKAEGDIRKIILGLERDTLCRVSNVSIRRGASAECAVSITLRK